MNDTIVGVAKSSEHFPIGSVLYIGRWAKSIRNYEFTGWMVGTRSFSFCRKEFPVEEYKKVAELNSSHIQTLDRYRSDLYKYTNYLFDKCDCEKTLDNCIIIKTPRGFYMYPNARIILDYDNFKDKFLSDIDSVVLISNEGNSITYIRIQQDYNINSYREAMKRGYIKIINETTYKIIQSLIQNRYDKIYGHVASLVNNI